MRFVDSHLHLDSPDVGETISNAGLTGTLLLSCGTDRKTSESVIKLAKAHPDVVMPFVGTHPSEATKEKSLGWLPDLLEGSVGLGEVGLDPTYSSAGPRGAQVRVLKAQLRVSERGSKPVQVHSRQAEAEALAILSSYRLPAVLMHWFEDERKIAEVLDRGYFVSYGPAILYSKKLQRLAESCGPGQVLTESDSPVPYRALGGVRGPSLIPSVVFKLAELWGTSFQEARASVFEGSMRYLGVSEKG